MRGGRGRGDRRLRGKEGRRLDGGLATAVAWRRRRVVMAAAEAPHDGGGSAQGAVRVPKP